MDYDAGAVRRFVEAALSEGELGVFCFDHFLGVYDDFAAGQTKQQRVLTLVNYARQQVRLGELVGLVRAINPAQYDRFAAELGAAAAESGAGEEAADEPVVLPLARLPLDKVPPPAPLPPGSHVPVPPNPRFVGREPDLLALAAALKAGGVTVVAAVAGMGGVGKTQLAAEFAHRYGRYFAGGVHWISCADPSAMTAEVAACGEPGVGGERAAGLPEALATAGPDLAARADLVRRGWERPLPRLLIFDNCEAEELLRQWRPVTGGSRVLVTSRKGDWDPELVGSAVALGILQRQESIQLLRGYRPDLQETDPALAGIAAELGDLPLALRLAGSYLRLAWPTTAAYLADLRSRGALLHASMDAPSNSQATGNPAGATPPPAWGLASAFDLSYARLDPQDPTDALAQVALARAALFAPGEPIPRELLLATLSAMERRGADALRRLVALGLLAEEADGALRLHRLLAAYAVARPASGALAAVVTTVESHAQGDDTLPIALLPLQPHLRAVAEAAARAGHRSAGNLFHLLGAHRYRLGNYVGARAAFERALALKEAALPPDDLSIANSRNSLGLVLRDQGDLAGARGLHARTQGIYEAALPPGHEYIATGLNNLALVLRDQGDLAGARALHERALAIHEAALPPGHPKIANSLNNLANVLHDQGDLAGARGLLERALAIWEQALPPGHPDIAYSLSNLASVLRDQGDLAGARGLQERALAIAEAALPPGHWLIAVIHDRLARVLRLQGDLAGARARHARVLASFAAKPPPDRRWLATALNNLGETLRTQGDLAGARVRHEEALRIYEEALLEGHWQAAAARHNLGLVLRDLGELEAAREAFARALTVRERVLPPGHPDIVASRDALAEVQRARDE